MRSLPKLARLAFGLLFLLTGLDKLHHFLPELRMSLRLIVFTSALQATRYFWQFLGLTEAAVGALLLADLCVPLALTVAAPVVVNIVLAHVFLDPRALPLAAVVALLEAYLAWVHRAAFRSVLSARS